MIMVCLQKILVAKTDNSYVTVFEAFPSVGIYRG